MKGCTCKRCENVRNPSRFDWTLVRDLIIGAAAALLLLFITVSLWVL